MRQVMWQKGGIASTDMTEMHAYGYSLKDTTSYASGGLNFRSARLKAMPMTMQRLKASSKP